jgi:hypothetical protein
LKIMNICTGFKNIDWKYKVFISLILK